jgi:hypothetical protein
MKHARRLGGALLLAGAMALGATPAQAAQELPAGCSKDKGTITCTETTTDGPGKNQGGVGTTTTTTKTTKGNTENFSPEPQGTGTETDSSCKPPKSQGAPGCN